MSRLRFLGLVVVVLGGVIIGLQVKILGGQKALQNRVILTDNFPQVTTYPGAVLLKSSCNDAQSMLFRSSWTSPDKVSQVMDWYTTELQKEGWLSDVKPGDPASESIQYAEFTRGLFNSWLSKLQLSVTADKSSGLSKIEISFPAPDSEHEEGEN
jgi:hypothetical protein